MPFALQGIVPPLVTPFDRNEEVDVEALRAEVQHHLDLGVHGVCVGGSTGEGATLSAEDVHAVAAAAVQQAAGRVPVIAGIIRDSVREVVRYGQAIRSAGADGLQVTPVHYLFTPGAEATVAFYRQIADEVGLPVVIYNVVPWAAIPPTTLCRVLADVPGVIGVKQSGGDIHALADLLHAGPEGAVLTAIDDLLYPSFVLGADGAIAAILTVAPELCVKLWDAVRHDDHKTALELHEKLLPIWRAVDGSNMPARIKAALQMQRRRGGIARRPIDAVSEDERAAVERALHQAGMI